MSPALFVLLSLVSSVHCLPSPTNNFIATLSQAQAWDLEPAMFQVYSAEDIGFRWDLPLDGENYYYDIQNKVGSMICILFQTVFYNY